MDTRSVFALFVLLLACDEGGTAAHDAGLVDAPEMDAALSDASVLDAPSLDGGLERVVETAHGLVSGTEENGSVAYKGIPYATPPLGELRWRSPTPPGSWDGVLDAAEFSSPCVQPTGILVGEPGSSFGDEDCLYLNVWTPSDRDSSEPLPVMVFLHGGGNIAGTAADSLDVVLETEGASALYDGSRLSARGRVLVVTLNYRLGVLGFMMHPELAAEAASGASGNYGLQDQIAALEWVRDNIASFGGDPERVLLFGQSGGGRDTLLLVTSPKTTGLFSSAVIHSAPLGAQRAAENARQRELLVEEMGCAGSDQVACLRAMDPNTLVRARAAQPLGLASAAFRPSVDGDVVPDQPLTRIAAGRHQPIPIMIGTNENEYSHRWEDVTATTYPISVTSMVGADLAEAAMAQYPIEDYADAREAFYTLMSDRNVTCPVSAFARVAADVGTELYLYRFREVLSTELRVGVDAYHTSELIYLFQHMTGEFFDVDEDDRLTERVMLDYWTAFASTGSPNGTEQPTWPQFTLAGEGYMGLEATPMAGDHIKQAHCEFWESTR